MTYFPGVPSFKPPCFGDAFNEFPPLSQIPIQLPNNRRLPTRGLWRAPFCTADARGVSVLPLGRQVSDGLNSTQFESPAIRELSVLLSQAFVVSVKHPSKPLRSSPPVTSWWYDRSKSPIRDIQKFKNKTKNSDSSGSRLCGSEFICTSTLVGLPPWSWWYNCQNLPPFPTSKNNHVPPSAAPFPKASRNSKYSTDIMKILPVPYTNHATFPSDDRTVQIPRIRAIQSLKTKQNISLFLQTYLEFGHCNYMSKRIHLHTATVLKRRCKISSVPTSKIIMFPPRTSACLYKLKTCITTCRLFCFHVLSLFVSSLESPHFRFNFKDQWNLLWVFGNRKTYYASPPADEFDLWEYTTVFLRFIQGLLSGRNNLLSSVL